MLEMEAFPVIRSIPLPAEGRLMVGVKLGADDNETGVGVGIVPIFMPEVRLKFEPIVVTVIPGIELFNEIGTESC